MVVSGVAQSFFRMHGSNYDLFIQAGEFISNLARQTARRAYWNEDEDALVFMRFYNLRIRQSFPHIRRQFVPEGRVSPIDVENPRDFCVAENDSDRICILREPHWPITVAYHAQSD